jgi:predicted peroxiredoxin
MNPFPALAELFKAYRESGGKFYVCSPCMQARNIKKDDLVEGATVVSAATFVAEISTVKNALVY